MSALSDTDHVARPSVLYLIKHQLRVVGVAFKSILEFSIYMMYKPRKSMQKFCENLRVFYHIQGPFTGMRICNDQAINIYLINIR